MSLPEDSTILAKYSTASRDELLLLMPGRTMGWIRQRAHRIGALRGKRLGPRKIIKIGDKFGILTVQERISEKKGNSTRIKYRCSCECSCNTVYVSSTHLVRGTKSCGCLTASLIRDHKQKDYGYSCITQIMRSYETGALDRYKSWSLTRDQFQNLIISNCYYCGSPPSRTRNSKNGSIKWNGIDRVNNKKGYSLDNCVACCRTCNIAKWDTTAEEFIKWICKIHTYQLSKGEIK